MAAGIGVGRLHHRRVAEHRARAVARTAALTRHQIGAVGSHRVVDVVQPVVPGQAQASLDVELLDGVDRDIAEHRVVVVDVVGDHVDGVGRVQGLIARVREIRLPRRHILGVGLARHGVDRLAERGVGVGDGPGLDEIHQSAVEERLRAGLQDRIAVRLGVELVVTPGERPLLLARAQVVEAGEERQFSVEIVALEVGFLRPVAVLVKAQLRELLEGNRVPLVEMVRELGDVRRPVADLEIRIDLVGAGQGVVAGVLLLGVQRLGFNVVPLANLAARILPGGVLGRP